LLKNTKSLSIAENNLSLHASVKK